MNKTLIVDASKTDDRLFWSIAAIRIYYCNYRGNDNGGEVSFLFYVLKNHYNT